MWNSPVTARLVPTVQLILVEKRHRLAPLVLSQLPQHLFGAERLQPGLGSRNQQAEWCMWKELFHVRRGSIRYQHCLPSGHTPVSEKQPIASQREWVERQDFSTRARLFICANLAILQL
jgi:hypothetical protein